MRIEVIEQKNKHNRDVWEFNVFETTIVLIGKREEEKPPKKRLWRTLYKFDKYHQRDSTLSEPKEIPDWVKEEAAEKLKSMITVKTWDEWKQR